MVEIKGKADALAALRTSLGRGGCLAGAVVLVLLFLYTACTARVAAN